MSFMIPECNEQTNDYDALEHNKRQRLKGFKELSQALMGNSI